jgi:cell division protease FtsH
MYGRWLRNSFIYLLILVAIVAIVFTLLPGGGESDEESSRQELITAVKSGDVDKIDVDGDTVKYKLDGADQTYKFKKEQGQTVSDILESGGIAITDPNYPEIQNKEPSFWSNLPGLLIQFLPIIFIVAILFFFLRQAQGSSNQAMSFGKSKARMFTGTRSSVTFLDVAGVEEAKEELGEVVEFLKFPEARAWAAVTTSESRR